MKIATGIIANTLKNFGILAIIGGGIGFFSPSARAGDLMDWLAGATGEQEKIEYPERGPLIVPPALKLPAPKSSASAGDPAWPKDPDLERKRKAKEADLASAPIGRNNDPSRPMTPAELSARPGMGGPASEDASAARRDFSKPLSPLEMQALNDEMARQKQLQAHVTASSKSRVYLTDPPSVYRQPAKLTPEMEAQAAAAGSPVNAKPWYQFW